MGILNDAARELIAGGANGHLTTINADGSAAVALVWIGLDGDELVAGHLDARQHKLANMRREPRVVVSFEGGRNAMGLREYLVVHGRARITEGGAPELLARLAHVYLGPDVVFPGMPNPPAGFITHITVDRVGGNGPWA